MRPEGHTVGARAGPVRDRCGQSVAKSVTLPDTRGRGDDGRARSAAARDHEGRTTTAALYDEGAASTTSANPDLPGGCPPRRVLLARWRPRPHRGRGTDAVRAIVDGLPEQMAGRVDASGGEGF
jgi:hypothetical protein